MGSRELTSNSSNALGKSSASYAFNAFAHASSSACSQISNISGEFLRISPLGCTHFERKSHCERVVLRDTDWIK